MQELALLLLAGQATACCAGSRVNPRAAAALSQVLAVGASAAFCWGLYCSVGLWEVRLLRPVLHLKRGGVFLAAAYQESTWSLSLNASDRPRAESRFRMDQK